MKSKKKTKKRKSGNKSTKPKLNPNQRKFAELYATDKEFFGNGVQAYIEAYGIKIKSKKEYRAAKSSAYNLLTNTDFLEYVNKLIDITLNDIHVDKQLAFLIIQNAELTVKLGAIKEYNALKARIIKKLEHSGLDGGPIPVSIIDYSKVDLEAIKPK